MSARPSDFTFVRYTVTGRHGRRTEAVGLFRAAYKLRKANNLPLAEQEEMLGLLLWIQINVPPSDLDFRDARKDAVHWYREEAAVALEHTSELSSFLEQQGFTIGVTRTPDPGLIVYADEHQVAALRCGTWHRLGYRVKDGLVGAWRWVFSLI